MPSRAVSQPCHPSCVVRIWLETLGLFIVECNSLVCSPFLLLLVHGPSRCWCGWSRPLSSRTLFFFFFFFSRNDSCWRFYISLSSWPQPPCCSRIRIVNWDRLSRLAFSCVPSPPKNHRLLPPPQRRSAQRPARASPCLILASFPFPCSSRRWRC